MSKKFQTNKKVAETIFGIAKANKILAEELTEEELKEAEYTDEDKVEDALIQSVVDSFFNPTPVTKNKAVLVSGYSAKGATKKRELSKAKHIEYVSKPVKHRH